jgi:hypothetical protein
MSMQEEKKCRAGHEFVTFVPDHRSSTCDADGHKPQPPIATSAGAQLHKLTGAEDDCIFHDRSGIMLQTQVVQTDSTETDDFQNLTAKKQKSRRPASPCNPQFAPAYSSD